MNWWCRKFHSVSTDYATFAKSGYQYLFVKESCHHCRKILKVEQLALTLTRVKPKDYEQWSRYGYFKSEHWNFDI